MAVGFQSIVTTGAIGLGIGAAIYLYYKGYFDKIMGSVGNIFTPVTGDGTTTTPTTTPPTVTEFNYYARPKQQCRDDNITPAYLQGQGVKVLNFKIFSDNKFYAQMCGMPSGKYFLIATAKGDGTSDGILKSLGFSRYATTPVASDLDPNIPIPGYPPPTIPPTPNPEPAPVPAPIPSIVAAIATDKTNYIVGEKINVIGTGFNANETVELRFKHINATSPSGTGGSTIGSAFTVTADANGAFTSNVLTALASAEIGQRYVQAKGLTSAKIVTKDITVAAAAASMSYAYLGEGDNYIGYPIYLAEML